MFGHIGAYARLLIFFSISTFFGLRFGERVGLLVVELSLAVVGIPVKLAQQYKVKVVVVKRQLFGRR